MEEWRPELAGVQSSFEIITDHKNLKTFLIAKQLNQRQVRWSEFLSQFNFVISYRPGSKALLPDTLSRLPGIKPEDASDERLRNRFRAMIPRHKVASDIQLDFIKESEMPDFHCIKTITTISPQISLIDAINQAYRENDIAKTMINYLQDSSKRTWLRSLQNVLRKDIAEFKLTNGLIYFRNRLYAPDQKELRTMIVHRTHSSGLTGHPGRVKTLVLIQRTYRWPQRSKFVAEFVKGCALCCRTKPPPCHHRAS